LPEETTSNKGEKGLPDERHSRRWERALQCCIEAERLGVDQVKELHSRVWKRALRKKKGKEASEGGQDLSPETTQQWLPVSSEMSKTRWPLPGEKRKDEIGKNENQTIGQD